MTIWICSYPRSGNSLVATGLLAQGLHRYEQYGRDMTRPDGIEQAIAAGRLPAAHAAGELILKTHKIADLDHAAPSDSILVPIRDGRDALVSYWHMRGSDNAIALWEELHRNGTRWDDWMLELEPHRRSGAAGCGLTGGLDGFPCRAKTVRFEAMAADLRWVLTDVAAGGLGLHELAPQFFRAGTSGQWRALPDREQKYLNSELGDALSRWGY